MAALSTLQNYLCKTKRNNSIGKTESNNSISNISSNNSDSINNNLLSANVICPSCGCPDLSYDCYNRLYTCQNCFEHDLQHIDLLNELEHPLEFKKLSLLYDARIYLAELLFSKVDSDISEREQEIFDLLFEQLRLATEIEVNQAGISRYIIKNNELSYRKKRR